MTIEFYGHPDCYVFQFSDNGIGFNDKSIQKGFGLDNIEKRILFYKGVFEINSTENKGSTIQISIPK